MPYDPVRMNDCLALCHVPRWSIVPHTRHQSVAEHTFRVLVIARELAADLGIRLRSGDLLAILTHDAPESKTGDIPTPAKRAINDTVDADVIATAEYTMLPWKEFDFATDNNSLADQVFKMADMIEAYTFICRYGEGPHAKHVAGNLLNQITAVDSASLVDAALRVIRDMESEEGRLWA